MAFVTTGLSPAGAELTLCRLVLGLHERGFEPFVFALTGKAELAATLTRSGISVTHVGLQGPATVWHSIRKLRKEFAGIRPEIVQTWMYHADFFGGLVAASLRLPLVWGVRNSSLSRLSSKRGTRWLVRVLAILSYLLPRRVIMNAEYSRVVHERLGYRKDRILVIPNGIDTAKFRRCEVARARVRAELGVDDEQFLVGMIARYDPQKDHATFIAAARIVMVEMPNTHFLLCGRGCDQGNRELTASIRMAGLEGRVLLLGERSDVIEVMNALDLHVLTSAYGEAFPNVLGEALACEVPSVATDVGDSAVILADRRWIVPPREPELAAQAWLDSLLLDSDSKARITIENRRRMEREYNLEIMVDRFAAVYRSMSRET